MAAESHRRQPADEICGLVALVLTTPTGLNGLFRSTPSRGGIAALVLLGSVSTGIAFACFVTLVGRVGAARASVAIYLVPVVAIVLGAFAASESIHPISLGGIALILSGAYLTSLRPRTPEVSASRPKADVSGNRDA